jgi:hypothetical protein
MSTTATITQQAERIVPLNVEANKYPKPLQPSGALDKFTFEESTPVIGREYPKVNLVDDIINAPNADELIRDLAITSASHPHSSDSPLTYDLQSHSEVSSFSAPKTTSQTNSTSSSSTASAN